MTEVHDLHVWAMSTSETALTAHLVMAQGHPGDRFIARVAKDMDTQFKIAHVTVQVELDPDHPCELAPAHVV